MNTKETLTEKGTIEKLNTLFGVIDKTPYEENFNLPLSMWADADKPRSKIIEKGSKALSDSELLAVLISQGDKTSNSAELAKKILLSVNNNLNELCKLSIHDLMKFKGMGEAKAASIIASIELGRRRKDSDILKREKVVTSSDAFEVLKPLLMDLPHEEFWVLFLNRSNHIIKKEMISRGGVSGTVVDSKIIFKSAIENLCSSMILSHNHPSGNRKPSDQDIQITKKIKEAGKLLEIPVLDHLIICDNTYYSFADEGIL